MTRTEIAALIVQQLKANEAHITTQFATQNYFVIDDLLPEALAHSIYQSFPDPSTMMLRKSIRELKYVTSQMNKYPPLLEEVVYAFHDPRVVEEVSKVTRLKQVEAAAKLYAGGISLMGPGHYLHPHLDNSHDMERQRYRILNLLYYTSPRPTGRSKMAATLSFGHMVPRPSLTRFTASSTAYS
jgi:Rps23 Pro-64 3,4-dihydroxylase Tpa1-like proline 4-hydroxylase